MNATLYGSADFNIGDRVVVSTPGSEFVAQAGYIVDYDPLLSLYYGFDIFVVLLESELTIHIAAASLVKSPYQDDEVPSD